MTKWFGKNAFNIYAFFFVILILGRGVLPWILGYANRETWNIDPSFGYIVSFIILLPIVYLMYSIAKYFTFRRALGIAYCIIDCAT